eukprot:4671829-Prymnesium_polylepis.2
MFKGFFVRFARVGPLLPVRQSVGSRSGSRRATRSADCAACQISFDSHLTKKFLAITAVQLRCDCER